MTSLQSAPTQGRGNAAGFFPQEKPEKPDTSDWWKRTEVAERLGVTLQTVKNYERSGRLHPVRETRRDVRGRERIIVLHDPNEVAYLRDKVPPKDKEPSIDTSTWLTRNEATDSLGVSTETLRKYEARGVLRAVRGTRYDSRNHERTMVLYNPEDLAKVPRGPGKVRATRLPGELNARANELFDQGKSVREVVTILRETSDAVRALRDRWFDDGGHELVVTPVAKEALEALVGPFQDVTELVEKVTAKLAPEVATDPPTDATRESPSPEGRDLRPDEALRPPPRGYVRPLF